MKVYVHVRVCRVYISAPFLSAIRCTPRIGEASYSDSPFSFLILLPPCSSLPPPTSSYLLLPPPPSSSLQADVEAFSKLPGVDAITVVMDGRMDLCDEYDAYGMGNRSRFPCDGAPDIRGMNDATLLDTAKQIASAVCRHASVSGYVSQLRRSCLFQVSASNSNRYLLREMT